MGGAAHTDIAAYVLGVLDEAENAVFEAHLLDCPHCQLDLLEMYELPEILAEVRKYWPDPPIPQPRALGGLLDEVALARRRRKTILRIGSAAAGLLIVAGPLVTVALDSDDDSYAESAPVAASAPASTAPSTSLFDGGESGKGLQAQVIVQQTTWGSAIQLVLNGVSGPQRCQLVAVPWAGPEVTVAGWTVPQGTTAEMLPLRVSGGTGLAPADISRFEIRDDGGTVLASIPR
ncbi:zf-HC2 domain-containing protein [Amycolatopsis acidicola]|uniref:Zf-HC2 domain-containing protein n=1 Tax=Amycolatopsis acidicola TaxID=2596893 RepID=A0A5N0URF8_9PSEU|nr:zf-HC2 domain-containing protein [Amycolatopsis acidicola]KAA9153344.1 zf-HC2 domain-containing protein [Amycolatopsis acidicola]